MKVSAQYAEEHFADILNTAMRGEDVEIATPEQASVRLTLVKPAAASVPAASKVRPLVRLKGLIELPTDEECATMDTEIEEPRVNASLISKGSINPTRRPRREVWGAWEGLVTVPDQEEWDKNHQDFLHSLPDFSRVDDGVA